MKETEGVGEEVSLRAGVQRKRARGGSKRNEGRIEFEEIGSARWGRRGDD